MKTKNQYSENKNIVLTLLSILDESDFIEEKVLLKSLYIKVSDFLFNGIVYNKLTSMEIRVLLLIIRASWGCHRDFAYLEVRDFEVYHLDQSDVRKTLKKLVEKKLIGWDQREKIMWITKHLLRDTPLEEQETMRSIIGKNLNFPEWREGRFPRNKR
jgi:hypothetical protein